MIGKSERRGIQKERKKNREKRGKDRKRERRNESHQRQERKILGTGPAKERRVEKRIGGIVGRGGG